MAHLDPELLSAYIDAELSPDDMRQVEEHLAVCETCRREHAELRGISTMVRELPVYLPRRVVEIDAADQRRPANGVAKILEFAKPLAVAALILLVAFAGLRLLVDNDDGGDEEGQISFSAIQQTPENGTDPAAQASEPVAARDAPPNAAWVPADEDGELAESSEQEAVSDSEFESELPPAAAEQAAPTATAIAPAPEAVEPDTDDDGPSYWLIGALVAIAITVALSAARYALRTSPRRPRQ
jgi:hypothetical protein